ncbi:Hypothetical protein A7982_09751 [Minicystis rosea]|nr:Hypothetical protein A7982_09751 [Minicystis rosea]
MRESLEKPGTPLLASSRRPVVIYMMLALSLVVAVVVAVRSTIGLGLLALPTTFLSLVLLMIASAMGVNAYRWYRNPVWRTCNACRAPMRYRDDWTCGKCGTTMPVPRA